MAPAICLTADRRDCDRLSAMPLIIDGYNLLHVTGVSGKRGDLQGARDALLRLLAHTIDAAERPRTTIVFDAADAPPGLPRTVIYQEMTIHYASNYDNADEMIEELIASHHVPRSLTVVSSDHRIQRAARRRKAPFLDSDRWFAEASRNRARRRQPPPSPTKPHDALSGDDVRYWVGEFATDLPADESPADAPAPSAAEKTNKPRAERDPFVDANPFPPGYAEDLLDEN